MRIFIHCAKLKEDGYNAAKIFSLLVSLTITILYMSTHKAEALSKSKTEEKFQEWLTTTFWDKARFANISDKTLKLNLKRVRLAWSIPGLPKLQKTQQSIIESQAEFRSPALYFSVAKLQRLSVDGRELLNKWNRDLREIERRYKVPARILVAIWGVESSFGRVPIRRKAISVLATMAYLSGRRQLFEKELIAALTMIDRGYIDPSRMRSSWAGALGQPQFLPSSFLKFAVDFDGDGRRDIWNSVPDSLASIANFLKHSGWQTKRDWGYEVHIPEEVSCAQEGQDHSKPIKDWIKDGIKRVSGKSFPDYEIIGQGMMLVPAGRDGPHFIVTPNFYALKKYNNSDLYALFIGHLADRIAFGLGSFSKRWPDLPRMRRHEIAAAQQRLVMLGYDVGGVDGRSGHKTRRSIGHWQERMGAKSTCFPSPELLESLSR